MDESHRLATDIAKHFLTSRHEPTREDSRLFEDLQQFALEALKIVRSGDPVPQAGGQKGAWLRGRSSHVELFSGVQQRMRFLHR